MKHRIMRLDLLFFICWVATTLLPAVRCQISRYNPCTTPAKVTRGSGFVVGLALWPGGTLNDWMNVFNSSSGAVGWNPCLNYTRNGTFVVGREYLEQQGVVFGTYGVRVDTLTSISLFWQDLDELWNTVPAGKPKVISGIVFRGGFRSEPMYIRSDDVELTNGNGTATKLSFVARFDRGLLEKFEWNTGGCEACGGYKSSECINARLGRHSQQTCGVQLTEANCTVAPSISCRNFTMYMGYVGADKNSVVFKSGYQVNRVAKFSLSRALDRLSKAIDDILKAPSALFNSSETLVLGNENGLA